MFRVCIAAGLGDRDSGNRVGDDFPASEGGCRWASNIEGNSRYETMCLWERREEVGEGGSRRFIGRTWGSLLVGGERGGGRKGGGRP
jgi:hypothetical protein